MRTKHILAVIAAMQAAPFAPALATAPAQDAITGPTLTVQGQGIVSLEPDRAIIRLGTSDQAETPGEAQESVNATIARAIEVLETMDVAGLDLQTASINLNPVYDHKPKRGDAPEIVGYRAGNSLRITIDDVSKVGTVIDAGINAGLRELQGVSFALRHEESAKLDALRTAALEAKRKARVVADAMDVKLDRLESIIEGGATVTPINNRFYGGMASVAYDAAGASPTPVASGKIDVRATLTLVYRIRAEQ